MEEDKFKKYAAYAVIGLIAGNVITEIIPHKADLPQDPP